MIFFCRLGSSVKRGRRGGRHDQLLDQVVVAHHQSKEGGLANDMTNFLSGEQGGGAPNLFTPNSRVHHHGGAGRVVPSIWTGTPGVAAMPRTL